MGKPNGGRNSVTLVLLALIVAVLAAILLAGQIAEAKGGGGGGRGGGGGGGPKASSSSSSKSSSGSSAGQASGDKGLPPGVANPSSPYYNSPNYGLRHGALSNFFLWSWLFHDRDDDDYEEEYITSNYDSGGWLVTVIGLIALIGIPIWLLRRRRAGG